MDYSALATSLVSTGTNGLLNATTGIPGIMTALVPVIVLTAGIRWFFRLKRKVGI